MNTVLVAIHICWYKSQYEVTLMPNCFHKTVHRYPFCMSGCVEFHIFFLVEECWWNVFEKSRFCLKWRNFRYAVLWKRFEMFFSTRFSNFVPVTFRFWHQADFFLVQQNGFFFENPARTYISSILVFRKLTCEFSRHVSSQSDQTILREWTFIDIICHSQERLCFLRTQHWVTVVSNRFNETLHDRPF